MIVEHSASVCATFHMARLPPTSGQDNEDDPENAVFLEGDDVDQEILIDEEDLPDVDEEEEEIQVPGGEAGSETEDGNWEEDNSIHIFTGHSDAVYAIACSPTDPDLVATGGGDDKAYLWRLRDSASPLELRNHSDSVGALAFSSDGVLLASGGLDGAVNIWETSSGVLKLKLEGPSEAIEWVRWHPRGQVVLAGSEDFTCWMWNAVSGACLTVLAGHNGPVTCGDFTPDGKTVCTGSADGSLRVWNPRSGESIHIVQGHPYHTEGLTCLGISSDSSIAITGSTDSSVHVVNIRTGKVVGALNGHSKSIECVALARSLPLAATGGMDGKLIIWDLQTLTPRITCEHEEGIIRLIWSESSGMVLTGCLDGMIRAWDYRTGTCETTFHGHEDAILDLALSQGERYILSSSDDKTARVFEFRMD